MDQTANLEHRNYGAMGSEFILHHCALRPKRLMASFLVTTALSAAFKLHEMNVRLLWMLSLLLAVVLVMRLFYKVSKEVLLVLPSVGVQVRTQYWFGHQETQFFDKTKVKGIVITEAVTMQSVLCYLAVLLSSHPAGPIETVIPLFTHSLPSLKDLVYMYRTVECTCPDYTATSVHQDSKESKRGERTQELGAGDTTPARCPQEGAPSTREPMVLRSKRSVHSTKMSSWKMC